MPDCAKRETFPEISFREFKPSREKGIFRTDEFYCGVQIALETPLNVPSGWYWLEIDGMGSTLAGVGCILEASVSETLQGTVELDTKWSKKGLLIRIPEKVDADASAAILKLDFVNDLWDPVTREDRNLHFRGVQLIPCRKAGTFTTTLAPACAVKVAPNFVVDCVKWFSPEFPTDRAARYVLGVLQSVGVEIPWKPSSACISAEDWDEKTSSLWNLQKSGDMPILFIGTNGMVQKRVVFGKSGRFAFSLNAYGTSCEGVFPHLRLLIDGETVGEFLIDSAEMRNYALRAPIQIEAGEHEIALEFHNDHYIPSPDPAIPHQDRNVRLGSLQIFLED